MVSGFGLATTLSVILVAPSTNSDTVAASNTSASAGDGEVREYCVREAFSARCRAHDEVVLMTSAHYGRMRLGRCVGDNYGKFGCQLDVKTRFDAWCSGRRTCNVRVSSIIDSLPEGTLPCGRDLHGYLEASYTCMKVVSKSEEQCRRSGSVTVPVEAGVAQYLASVVTEETGCGSSDRPWTLRAPRGQTIHIRLLSFQTALRSTSAAQHQLPPVCRVYAVIRERWSTRPGVTICGGSQRDELVYSSLSDLVEIRVVAAARRSGDYFLMKIEATGCTDLTWSGRSGAPHWMERSGDGALLGCNTTSNTWRLTCDGSRWVGVHKSCPDTPTPEHLLDRNASVWEVFTASQWAALAVILAIAVAVGMFIFLVGLIYTRRRRSRKLRHIRRCIRRRHETMQFISPSRDVEELVRGR